MDHPPESEIQEIQRNELEALQSILGEDFTQVETKTAWKVSNPASKLHEFEITLRPEEEDLKPAVHAVLHVRLPKTYPRAIPFLSLVPGRAKGLSPTHLRNLGDALQSKAKTLLGAEMVWELVSYAQELISTQNLVAKANAAPNLSLEEEMRRRALEVDKVGPFERSRCHLRPRLCTARSASCGVSRRYRKTVESLPVNRQICTCHLSIRKCKCSFPLAWPLCPALPAGRTSPSRSRSPPIATGRRRAFGEPRSADRGRSVETCRSVAPGKRTESGGSFGHFAQD